MSNDKLKWLYLIILALMWGSSFILIKKGLVGLSPIQLGAFRILVGTIILLIIGYKKLKKIKKPVWKWLAVSGLLGTFFPSILFAYAETEIDSAIASILNSSVPLLALIIGLLFYNSQFKKIQFIGVIIGLIGCVGLILIGSKVNPNQNYWFATLPIIASTMYAFNANIIKSKLQNVSALGIAVGSFLILVFPSIGLLIYTGFFNIEFLSHETTQTSLFYIVILGIFGTVIAKIIFNRLIQISDPIFSTSVAYLIPIVALFWGIIDGESFNLWQILGGFFILAGVYVSNLKKDKTKN